jgi:hypothetical protein
MQQVLSVWRTMYGRKGTSKLCSIACGGPMLRDGDGPPHGGFRGYVADPDDHAWEIAWNPAWKIDDNGMVKFGL